MKGEGRPALTKISWKTQKAIALLLYLGLIGVSLVCARAATAETSILVQFLALAVAGIACVHFSKRGMLSRRERLDLLILGSFGLLFTGTALLCNGEKIYERIAFAWGLLSLVTVVAAASGLCNTCPKPSMAGLVSWAKGHWPEMAIISIYIVAYLPNFDLWIKGDSATYYRLVRELPNWNLSFDGTLDYAQFGGHFAYGFAVLNYPISVLLGGSLFGLRLCNLVMSCLAIAMIPSLLRELFSSIRERYVFGCTALFAFSPLVFGLSAEFSVDAYSLYILVLICFLHVRKAKILLGATCLAYIFTKEVNAVVLFLYAVFTLVYEIKRTSIAEYMRSGGMTNSLMFLIAGSFFILVASMQKTSAWTVSQQVSGMNNVGVNWLYIVTKAKEIILMNGHWLLLIAAVLLFAIRGGSGARGNRCHERSDSCVSVDAGTCRAGIIGAFIGFILYSLFFVTYVTYRYIQPLILFVVVGFAALCSQASRSRSKDCLLFAVLVFYIGCNFYTEPVTRLLFKNIDAGNGVVVTTRTFIEVNNAASTKEEDLKNYLISNAVVYNRQYIGIERCIERLIADVDDGGEITILVPDVFGNQTIRSTFGSALDTETYYWDSKTGNIVLDMEGEDSRELHLVEFDGEDAQSVSMAGNTYVLIMPFEDVLKYTERLEVEKTIYETSGVWRFGLAKVSGEQ